MQTKQHGWSNSVAIAPNHPTSHQGPDDVVDRVASREACLPWHCRRWMAVLPRLQRPSGRLRIRNGVIELISLRAARV